MNTMGAIGFLLSLAAPCSALAQTAPPYTILILEEPGIDESKVLQLVNTMRAHSPFKELGYQLQFKFVLGNKAMMNCTQNPKIERVVRCDPAYAQSWAAHVGADTVLNITTLGTDSGSGGVTPTISTHADPGVAIHELAHSIAGLADEYEYTTRAEYAEFCLPPNGPRPSPNVAFFRPALASYPNDGVARGYHAAQIPWYGQIAATTPIINGTSNEPLGTPESKPFHWGRNANKPGLYPGGFCNNVIPSWHSMQGDNAMNEYGNADLNPIQARAFLRAMEKKRGARFVGVSLPAFPTDPEATLPELGSGPQAPVNNNGGRPAN